MRFGIAASQLVSMYNYYRRVVADTAIVNQLEMDIVFGVPTEGAFFEIEPGTGNYLVLKQAAPAAKIDIPGIDDNTVINLAGHSLGGHLAAAFTRLFPNNVNQAYTYNAPGFDTTLGDGVADQFLELFEAFDNNIVSTSFDTSKITTLKGELGPSIISDLGTPPSPQQIIFAEENKHGLNFIKDPLLVYSLLENVDQTIDADTVSEILTSSSNNALLSVENVVSVLNRLFLNDDKTVNENDREALYERFSTLQNYLDSNNFQNLSIININALSSAQLSQLAEQNIEYRYALQALQNFVILEGGENIYSIHNTNGEFNIENFSDQYLQDRAEFLALKINIGINDTLRNNTDFPENEYNDLGSGIEIFNSLDSIPSLRPQYIFGSQTSDPIIEGRRGDDHLYGQGGSDVLIGDVGEDYLEGGQGEDFLIGGVGNDTLVGGVGLRNNQAGSDSEADQLYGGDGSDSYYVNNGDLIIDDQQGQGEVFFNGTLLTGGTFISESEYQGGGFTYILNGGELTVRDTSNNAITIQGYRKDENGYLGITLAGDPEAGTDTTTQVPVSTQEVTRAFGDPNTLDDDTILGTDDQNSLYGAAGNDVLQGFANIDYLVGNWGDDEIDGGDGDDWLVGDGFGTVNWSYANFVHSWEFISDTPYSEKQNESR